MEGRRMMNDGRALIEGLDEIWREVCRSRLASRRSARRID
jgi:hypothetical protein